MSSVTATTRRVLQACAATAVFCILLLAVFWRYTHYRARLAVAELMEMAREEDTSVERGYHLINNLSRLGPAGIQALARELRSDERWRRCEADSVLTMMDILNPTRTDLGTYAELVDDQRIDPHVRVKLARTILSRVPDRPDRSIPRYMDAALGDPDAQVRGVAAAVLWRMGRRGEELVGPLAQALELLPRQEDVERVVVSLDRPGEPTFEAGSSASERPVCAGDVVAEALRAFGEKAVPALAAAVAEGDGSPRAAELLAELGPKAAPAASALVRSLARGWPWDRDWHPDMFPGGVEHDPAARALVAIGKPAGPAIVAALEELSGEEQGAARVRLLHVLERIGEARLDVALSQFCSEDDECGRWGAWHVTRCLLEAESAEWPSRPEFLVGEDGSPPECVVKLFLGHRDALLNYLWEDYDELPALSPRFGYRMGGRREGPWWTWPEYRKLSEALGYRRTSARMLAAWVAGLEGQKAPELRERGGVPPSLAKCAEDPDEGVRSAARWAVGVLKAETAPARTDGL